MMLSVQIVRSSAKFISFKEKFLVKLLSLSRYLVVQMSFLVQNQLHRLLLMWSLIEAPKPLMGKM